MAISNNLSNIYCWEAEYLWKIAAENENNKKVVLYGDAQFDSPGFSAKYCT